MRMSSKIERLEERVDAIDRSQPGRKKPTLMSEPEGEAWIYYCISLLSEDERRELDQVVAGFNKGWENRPGCKNREEWKKYDDEHTRLLHRHGELIALGEARAEAAPWEPWTRFEVEYRDAKAQLAKVRLVESSSEGETN
jgi:hypothetical protein